MAIAGKNGQLKIGTAEGTKKVIGIKNWSLSLVVSTIEETQLGDDWKSYILGLKEWTASSSGNYEVTSEVEAGGNDVNQEILQQAYLDGTKLTADFYVDGTHYYSGQAVITSLTINDPVDGVVDISIELSGCGALTFE